VLKVYNNEFWSVVLVLAAFFIGIAGGMLIDYEAERRAAKKEYLKQLEKENKQLKAKNAFYESLLEERSGR
jgi:uncharacterized protein YbjQ (UPF0145 family)